MISVSLLSSCYRLIAELLLYPEERDSTRIEIEFEVVRRCPASILNPIERFLSEPDSSSVDEYLRTLELSPCCPLYLGSYLYEEPKTCRGAALSGRNSYMIELSNIYKHFGYELNGKELPDFLPVMVDFLWMSLERQERDSIGLRRFFIDRFLLSGLKQFLTALKKYKSPYAWLAESLEAALGEDVACVADQPVWKPPDQDLNEQHQSLGVDLEAGGKRVKP